MRIERATLGQYQRHQSVATLSGLVHPGHCLRLVSVHVHGSLLTRRQVDVGRVQATCTAQQRLVGIVGLHNVARLWVGGIDVLSSHADRCLIRAVPRRVIHRVHTHHIVGVRMAHAVVRTPAELLHVLGLDALPGERCARHEEHVILRTLDGVLAVDAVERLHVHDHHVTFRAVNGMRRAVNVKPLRTSVDSTSTEFMKHVKHLAFCTTARQRCTHQTRIEQQEYAFTSEAALLVVLVRLVRESRRRRASHTHVALGNRLDVGNDGLQLRNLLGMLSCSLLKVGDVGYLCVYLGISRCLISLKSTPATTITCHAATLSTFSRLISRLSCGLCFIKCLLVGLHHGIEV